MSAVICPICSGRMTFRERILSFVCFNEKHGILQFSIGDQCYVTGRKETANKLKKKELKHHLIKDESLLTFGL
ncbi:MAG: hypothetical protein FJ358_02005 [Thaumarchaeota archaeon]|nr:hypothetical protein [Nitrososphaerota archaeon]